MDTNAYDTWLFDLDDTLIDFKKSMAISLKNCHQQFFSSKAFSDFQKYYTKINTELWQLVEKGAICPSELGQKRFESLAKTLQVKFDREIQFYYEEQLIENSHWIDHAEDLLNLLVKRKVKIGFVTNGFSGLQRSKFKKLGLDRYSEVLIISEEVGYSKPHRKIFDHTLEAIGALPSKTLMLGDSLTSDGKGAQNADLSFCWYNPNQKKSAHHFNPHHIVANWHSVILRNTSRSASG